MITTLYEDAPATREWLSNAPSGFKKWLEELRRDEIKQLKTQDEPRYLHRAQGRLDIIDRIIGLPAELQQIKGRS